MWYSIYEFCVVYTKLDARKYKRLLLKHMLKQQRRKANKVCYNTRAHWTSVASKAFDLLLCFTVYLIWVYKSREGQGERKIGGDANECMRQRGNRFILWSPVHVLLPCISHASFTNISLENHRRAAKFPSFW